MGQNERRLSGAGRLLLQRTLEEARNWLKGAGAQPAPGIAMPPSWGHVAGSTRVLEPAYSPNARAAAHGRAPTLRPGGRELCPRCATPRVGAFRYCRLCGFDYEWLASPERRFPPLVPPPDRGRAA